MSKTLTVGELREFLESFHPDTKITFGASRFRQRPLVFDRLKIRGEGLLVLELSELDDSKKKEVIVPSTTELDERETAGDLSRELAGWPDSMRLQFNNTLEGAPLELRSLSNLVGINLEQPREPNWKVRSD